MSLASGDVTALRPLPDDSSCGQPTWAPQDTHIVFTSWEHKASNFEGTNKRLGIVYCFNRPCHLYALAVDPSSGAPSGEPILLTGSLM